jgi:2-polyprenyl-6-methoxyphenol hydroxylase-like FAD-dependent oxidoreductase
VSASIEGGDAAPRSPLAHEVLIAGAGPVGLTLAIALGQRGVRCLVLERNDGPTPWPKMDRTNARSMEIFRRLGIADRIRALGYPPDNPMDVFLLTTMTEPPLAVLPFGSVAQHRAQVARCMDGSLPLEPYQLVAQNDVEPLLRSVAEALPGVQVRYGHEVAGLVQDEAGVRVSVKTGDGGSASFAGRWLVGCDGGSSTVRKALGIALEGRGGIRELRQVVFDSRDLYDRIPVGKGRHYNFIDGHSIIAQGNRRQFTLHSALPEGTDFVPVLRRLIGFDCEIVIRRVVTWRHNLLLAQRYREGRVFLAGDAAHLVIPTGGLGMNTGIGDAIDLAWKLEALAKGRGGPALADSYERERRPVGAFNVASAGWAAEGVGIWRALVTPDLLEPGPAGDAKRQAVRESFELNHGRMHGMRGAEFAYTYADSPLVEPQPDNPARWDRNVYVPVVRPGARIPHMWLKDGTPLQDALGCGFTLLDLSGGFDAGPIVEAFRSLGSPLDVVSRDERRVRDTFGRSVFLLRPDLHIVWSGDGPIPDPASLARRSLGHPLR